jgi:hypothetical protein
MIDDLAALLDVEAGADEEDGLAILHIDHVAAESMGSNRGCTASSATVATP